MEYRDLYDENRNKTGVKIKKGANVPMGMYYVTVVIFIENSKGKLLFQKSKKYNKWGTTGGHPKSGESSLEGIITEVKEELGLIIEDKSLYLFKTIKTEDDFIDLYYINMDIDINAITMQEDEVIDVDWFSKEEIGNLIKDNEVTPPHMLFYKEYLKYKINN